MSYFENKAQDGSKTRRKELRQEARNILGTSSDPAPTIIEALRAANKVQALLDLASNGTYGLAVVELRKIGAAQATGQPLPTRTISETISEQETLHAEHRKNYPYSY